MEHISLDEFRSSSDSWFSEGIWIVEYYDRTHLRNENYLPLGEIDIEESKRDAECVFSVLLSRQ